ncbi:hypothetical protein BKG95_02375 [Rodentibacter pneumotropicus]|uniref:Uncharacterized protein n=1 Tax=Rodentibacter pneumotropicus TaxID=758 RepID=A0A1V3K944_9PAST|nr:hypothetical protein [Rodentibacter pneumotropicus]MCQ9120961.1 hypothetical protein [Rodentibacter pneumotropicus]OOF69131.1 hypothetical protein BKG95_02375 [Rodentibacter pneumotropicus]VEH67280.1 Uncharacterised protein [Rodentibacter pneumotropicus]
MAFVTCSQFKTSQEEQDKKAISADDKLLDKSSGEGGGKVTIEKIKEAIAGDVEVAVKDKSGITGNGTEKAPLALNLGSSIKVSDEGKIEVDANRVANIRLVDASGTHVLGKIVGE